MAVRTVDLYFHPWRYGSSVGTAGPEILLTCIGSCLSKKGRVEVQLAILVLSKFMMSKFFS